MHLMLDLETFDSAPTAAIIQIGAAFFDFGGNANMNTTLPNGAPKVFERNVSLQSSLLAGLSVSPDTVKWWSGQSAEAKHAVSDGCVPLNVALAEFREWVLNNTERPDGSELEGVWAHGAAFDPPIMRVAGDAVGVAMPWSYRKVFDTRTMFYLAETMGWADDIPMPADQIRHTGAADALYQIDRLRAADEHIRLASAQRAAALTKVPSK